MEEPTALIMRPEVGILTLMVASASCLRVPGPPIALTNSGTRAVQAVHGPRKALLKIHDIRRGGGADQGSSGPAGLLAHVASFPLVEPLPSQVQTALVVNTVGFALLEATRKRGSILTAWGAMNAYVLGLVLWSCLGGWGWGICVLYLAAGSAVTKLKMGKKEFLGIAEGRGGARGPENVWGSAATGALCALISLARPQWSAALRVGFVASIATKLSDTCASEVGKAYGKRTFLITTFKPVPAGTEGAVSLEGTLAGVAGSAFLTGFAAASGFITIQTIPACLIAAFVATNFESVLGATTQGKISWLTNEVVNFVNTVVGAAVGVALGFAFGV